MEAEFSKKQVEVLQTVISDAIRFNNEFIFDKMDRMKAEILDGTAKLFDSVLSQIDDHEGRISGLETKVLGT